MPVAPPLVAAAWLRKLGWGQLIGVMLWWGALLLLLLVRWKPQLGLTLSMVVVAPAGVVATWLLTSSEPNNPSWERLLRWLIRVGVLVYIVLFAWKKIIAAGLFASQAISSLNTYIFLAGQLVSSGALVGDFWYRQHLAERLGDRELAKHFAVLKWIAVSLSVAFYLWILVTWPGHPTELTQRSFKLPLPAWAGASSMCFALLLLIVYIPWLGCRLFKDLRSASRALQKLGRPEG